MVPQRPAGAAAPVGPGTSCDAQHPPRAFFSTCPGDRAGDVVACFIKRWSIETTFEESRAHLGFETQRQWSDLAIERTTPCLLSLYSLVALLAHDLYLDGRLRCDRVLGMPRSRRRLATLWQRYGSTCGRLSIFQHQRPIPSGRNPSGLSAALDAIGLLHALT